MTQVPLSMIAGLGTAAALDAGTDPAEVPTNADLGTAAWLDTGTEAGELPTNADLADPAVAAEGFITNDGVDAAIAEAVNVASVSRTATGMVDVTFTDAMANDDYRVLINQDGAAGYAAAFSKATTGFTVETRSTGSGYPKTDRDFSFAVLGQKA